MTTAIETTSSDDIWRPITAWLEEGWNREATGSYDDLKLQPLQDVLQRMAGPLPLPCPITVAGTKGKGSTVLFCEAILRATA